MKQEDLQKFVIWTKLKIRIHISERKVFFKEREIWWCTLGKNIGFEQDGKHEMFERPVLILKKFNHDMLWVLPLTSQDKMDKPQFYFATKYNDEISFIILSQLRLVSGKRLLRKVRTLPFQEFCEVREKIKRFL